MATLLTKIVADFSTTTTAKWSVGATTGTLTSGLDSDGIQLPTGTYGFTIDRKNSSKEYFTATLTGASLTNIKSVTRGTGVGTAGLVREHRKGAEVIISDYVAIKRMMDVFDGTTSFDADVPLTYDGTPTFTDDNSLVTKAYADAIAIAGGADATTTIKGISKMSYAPASAASPIAVGDNDPRVPTQSENDALAGTSGTPSSTNKFVTNDDTATAATADKVARRLAGGNLTVVTESQGNNSTKAASTAYVDTGLTALPTFSSIGKYTTNTLPTYTGGYYTYEAPFLFDAGGGISGWVTNFTPATTSQTAGGYVEFSTASAGYVHSYLPGFVSTGSDTKLKYSNLGSNSVIIKGRFALTLGTTPIWGFGLSSYGTTSSIYEAYNSTAKNSIRFVYDGTKLYSVTSVEGIGATTNEITGITMTNQNIYTITVTSTSVSFYVNGVLKFTHTTNIPNASDYAAIATGISSASTSVIYTSPITITMPISAS